MMGGHRPPSTRGYKIRDVYVIPWEKDEDVWGIHVEFQGGSTMAERVGSKPEAQANKVLAILKDPEKLAD